MRAYGLVQPKQINAAVAPGFGANTGVRECFNKAIYLTHAPRLRKHVGGAAYRGHHAVLKVYFAQWSPTKTILTWGARAADIRVRSTIDAKLLEVTDEALPNPGNVRSLAGGDFLAIAQERG